MLDASQKSTTQQVTMMMTIYTLWMFLLRDACDRGSTERLCSDPTVAVVSHASPLITCMTLLLLIETQCLLLFIPIWINIFPIFIWISFNPPAKKSSSFPLSEAIRVRASIQPPPCAEHWMIFVLRKVFLVFIHMVSWPMRSWKFWVKLLGFI